MQPRARGASTGVRPRDLGLAIVTSLAVVLSAPFMGDLQLWLRRTLGPSFSTAVNISIAGVLVAAVLAAARRIRTRHISRWSAVALAIVLGAAYVLANALPVIERIHFAEYGLIVVVFRRAFAGSIVLATLASVIVSVADEWLQWFVPGRVGELRDLALNGAAIACGLLFSAGVDPPARSTDRSTASAHQRLVGIMAAAAVVILAAFIHSVHLGYVIDDAETGSFRSRYTADALSTRTALAAPRSSALSREDHFRTEGLWHVQERNRKWEEGDFEAAWRENRILEKYFAPVLGAGHAWPAGQQADAAGRRQPGRAYVSRAERYPIFAWSKLLYWLAAAAILGVIPLARPLLK